MAASVVIFSRVSPGREAEFLAWESEMVLAQQAFPGFLGNRVEEPSPASPQEWTVIVAFDTQEHLDAWLNSSVRREMLAHAADFNENLRLERTSYGFGFWGPPDAGQDRRTRWQRIWKSNLLVLLVLYPLIFLWGYAAGTPLFSEALGWPWWAVLFVGNFVSTQLLGWFLVPLVMKAFRRWLAPHPGWVVQLVGYAVVVVLCAGFMALYAWMIAAIGHS